MRTSPVCRSPSPARKRKASPSPAREAKGGSDRKRTRKPSDEPETKAPAAEDDAPVEDAAEQPAGAETCRAVVLTATRQCVLARSTTRKHGMPPLRRCALL